MYLIEPLTYKNGTVIQKALSAIPNDTMGTLVRSRGINFMARTLSYFVTPRNMEVWLEISPMLWTGVRVDPLLFGDTQCSIRGFSY